jgi:hypothetical protein
MSQGVLTHMKTGMMVITVVALAAGAPTSVPSATNAVAAATESTYRTWIRNGEKLAGARFYRPRIASKYSCSDCWTIFRCLLSVTSNMAQRILSLPIHFPASVTFIVAQCDGGVRDP